jgi:branched-chain amino acid transport system ATP-binding protein
MLRASGLRTGYDGIEVLRGVDLRVAKGEIVTVVGSNGAGKSTLLKAISGVIPVWTGSVRLDDASGGVDLTGVAVEKIVSHGLVQVPEGRQLFGPMSVEENLELGSYSRRKNGRPFAGKLREVYELFPRLEERRRQQAGTLSGGEQQMLAVSRALMAEPRFLLLDEPSMGLAPLVVKEIFAALRELNQARGLGMVLVEQDARMALGLAHRGMVLERGRVVLEDSADALRQNPDVQAIYFGRRTGRGSGEDT